MERHNVAFHDDHDGNVHIYYREWQGNEPGPKLHEVIKDFKWYFVIRSEDVEAVRNCPSSHYIDKIEQEKNPEWTRIYCQNGNYSKSKRAKGKTDAKMEI